MTITDDSTAAERSPADDPKTTPAETAAPDPATEEDRPDTANAEAARYRRQLRETQAERDGLSGAVERLQRAEVERLARERLDVPGDLWTFGGQLPDMLNEDGSVNSDAVQALVNELVQARPGLDRAAPRRPRPDSAQGNPAPARDRGDWGEVLRGDKR